MAEHRNQHLFPPEWEPPASRRRLPFWAELAATIGGFALLALAVQVLLQLLELTIRAGGIR